MDPSSGFNAAGRRTIADSCTPSANARTRGANIMLSLCSPPRMAAVLKGGSVAENAVAENAAAEDAVAKNRFRMGRAVGVAVVGLAATSGPMLWLALALPDPRTQAAQVGR